jgi:hypothetical protein
MPSKDRILITIIATEKLGTIYLTLCFTLLTFLKSPLDVPEEPCPSFGPD